MKNLAQQEHPLVLIGWRNDRGVVVSIIALATGVHEFIFTFWEGVGGLLMERLKGGVYLFCC